MTLQAEHAKRVMELQEQLRAAEEAKRKMQEKFQRDLREYAARLASFIHRSARLQLRGGGAAEARGA